MSIEEMIAQAPAELQEFVLGLQKEIVDLQQHNTELKKQIAALQKKNITLQVKYDSEVSKVAIYQKTIQDLQPPHDIASYENKMEALLAYCAIRQANKHGGWAAYENIAIEQAKNYDPLDDEDDNP